MTDIIDNPPIAKPSLGLSQILGPISLAHQQNWGAFWLFAMLDIWALVEFLNERVWLAAFILISGRIILMLGAHSLFSSKRLSLSDSTQEPAGPSKLVWIASGAYIASLALMLLQETGGKLGELLDVFPKSSALHKSIANAVDQLIRTMTVSFDPFFSALKAVLLTLLTMLEDNLEALPWPAFFLLVGFLAWQRGGWRVLALVWTALAYLGIFGFWDKAITTSALVLSALIVCILVGVPIGVLSAKNKMVRTILEPVLDFMQTLPSFVYLLPAVAFFSIGKPPALIATVVFALPPLIRLTTLGIEQVPGYVREAMFAHGATPLQTLIKAELPLALPSIQAGINQCIMMSLSMVVIAALIGGGGLGYDVLFALQNVQHGKGLLAGIAIVACAMMFDRLVRSSKQPTDKK